MITQATFHLCYSLSLTFPLVIVTTQFLSLESPTVTAPATVEVLSGSRLVLWCTVQTGAPARVQWIMDRRTLGPVVTRIGTANVTHIIPSVTNKDQGPYSCFASNVGGTATAVTTVIVKGKSWKLATYHKCWNNQTLRNGHSKIQKISLGLFQVLSSWRRAKKKEGKKKRVRTLWVVPPTFPLALCFLSFNPS